MILVEQSTSMRYASSVAGDRSLPEELTARKRTAVKAALPDDTLDGVMVRDRVTGRPELRHRHCIRRGEQVDGNEPLPAPPQRGDYPNDKEYAHALVARRVCAACGGVVPIKWRRPVRSALLAGER